MSVKQLAIVLCCAISLGVTHFAAHGAALEEEFRDPPQWTRPWCYWFWMDGDVTEEGIVKDLEAMADIGVQQVIMMHVNHNEQGTGPVKTMSDEWHELLRFSLRHAARLGIGVSMFNGPGWSQSGGPWNQPQHAMRYVTWNEVEASGGEFTGKIRPEGKYVQDIAVLAFARSDEVTISQPAAAGAIEFTHEEPFTARSLSFIPEIDSVNQSYHLVADLFAKQPDGKETLVHRINEIAHGNNIAVSFLPRGPETFSFEEASAKTFVLRIGQVLGVARIELSSEPKVAQVIEKQLGRMHPTPQLRWDTYIFPKSVEPDDASLVLDPERIVDLTDKLDAGGNLSCTLGPGQWTVIWFGMTPTGKTNAPASKEATGLEVDKMSKAAIEHHLDSMFSKLFSELSRLERSALKGITIDSYEVGGQNWTDGFAKIFEERLGYDPIVYLPVFTGRMVKSAKDSDRFLWDIRRLVADMIAEEYVGGVTAYAHRHGLTSWLENYGHWGYPGEFLKYGGYSDEISGEFWTNVPLGNIECRAASSAAHIYGKNRVYAEAYTSSIDLSHHPYSFKARGEELFCEGINHFVLTVTTHQPRTSIPGKNPAYGTAFHRNTPWYNKSHSFVKYLQRIHLMLQKGNPVADVAVYIGDFAPQMAGPPNPVPDGYDFDYINSDVIMKRLRVIDGDWVVYDEKDHQRIAARYKLLAMPELGYIRPQVRASLDRLVGQGGKLTDSVPVKPEVFQKMGVAPVVSDTVKPIRWKHRKTADMDIFFICNFNKIGPLSATFRSKGKFPVIFNPYSGQSWKTPWFEDVPDGTRVTLNVKDPSDSFFVLFRKGPVPPSVLSVQREGKDVSVDTIDLRFDPQGRLIAETATAGNYVVKLSDGSSRKMSVAAVQSQNLDGPWKIDFGVDNSTAKEPFSMQTDELLSWDKLSNVKAQKFNGTAVYETEFTPRPELLSQGRRVYLDLGSVHVMAGITVNGNSLDTLWMPPFRVDITELLRPRKNRLNIEVTSTSPCVSPGLLGPVRLMSTAINEL